MSDFYIYCDESYQDLIFKEKNEMVYAHYAFFGALKIPAKNYEELKAKINELRAKYGVYGELKWSTVSQNKIDFYLDLVELFFSYQPISFKCVVIDCLKIDHEMYNESDPELGYYKYYYMLLQNWLSDGSHRLYLDNRTNKYKNRYRELSRILNYKVDILSTQPINSKESDVLQMLNILLGAVAYYYNVEEKKSDAKKQILELIKNEARFGFSSTPLSEKKFNIFIPDFNRKKR